MNSKITELERRLHVPHTHAAATGYFLFVFSNVEEELNHAIWALLDVQSDSGGHVITTAVRDTGQRMLLLSKLAKARLSEQKMRDDCAHIVKAFQFVNDERVDLVHGTFYGWEPIDETIRLERWKSDGTTVKAMLSKFSTEYLCDLTSFTIVLIEAIMKFRYNVLKGTDLSLPSLDTRPQRSPQIDAK